MGGMTDEDGSDVFFDQIAYRRALGGFGTGVALVAADDSQGRSHGLIVNSLTSVSLDPPIILWCLANTCAAFQVFTDCPAFSVNILRAGEEDLVRAFSRKGDRILSPDQMGRMETGAPVLSTAVASLDCRMRRRQREGDHEVIFGDVVAYRAEHGVDALGFFRGQFVTLKTGA